MSEGIGTKPMNDKVTVLGIINGTVDGMTKLSTEMSVTGESSVVSAKTSLSISQQSNPQYGSLLAVRQTPDTSYEPGSLEERSGSSQSNAINDGLAGASDGHSAGKRTGDSHGLLKTTNSIETHSFLDKVRIFFQMEERKTNISREIKAGVVTFLTMSYITVINPTVLEVSGVPIHQAASSTCASATIATFIVGMFGNLPVGCAPGVGLSAYFVYGLAPLIDRQRTDTKGELITNYQIGFAIQLLSGLVVLLFTLCRVVPFIVTRIPEFLKLSTVVGMGIFLSFIGFLRSSIVVPGDQSKQNVESSPVLQLGDLTDWKVWLAMANVLLIGTLHIHEVSGSMLLGIIISTLIYWLVTSDWPSSIISSPKLADPFEIIEAVTSIPIAPLFTAGISFCLILIFDVSGVIFGVAEMADLLEKDYKTGLSKPKGGIWPFIAVSFGTIIAALTGCSPIIVHAESIAGVAAGGRTGLTALTISFLFLLSILFGPLFGSIPDVASAPTLILVGVFMMDQIQKIQWRDEQTGQLIMTVALPCFVCVTMMPFTFSIASGMFFGIGTWIILSVSGRDLCCPSLCNRSVVSPDEKDILKRETFSPVEV